MQHAFVISPNNGSDLQQQTNAVYVGGTGHLNVQMASGTYCLFSAIPAGTVLPIRVKKVFSTGTTATLIVGLVADQHQG